MKKLKPALGVLSGVTMALTLASPTLAETTPEQGGKVETFKEDKNMKEGQNIIYDGSEKKGIIIMEEPQENNDWDNDGIPNDVEEKGFKIVFNKKTGKNEAQLWDQQQDFGEKRFITNPRSANSDGDPFTDSYEVEHYGSDSDVDFNPMIANVPNLQIAVKRIDITPVASITDSNGESRTKTWEKSLSVQHSFNIGLAGEAGAEGSAAGPVPSGKGSLNVGYGYSNTKTETESISNSFDWSTATTVDSAKAANVRFHLEYKNTGTASAGDVSPHFNIRLGNKIINTVKATQDRYKANLLTTEKGGNNKTEILMDSVEGQADVKISLTLDELKAVEQGAPLSIEVLPTSTMNVYTMKDGKFENLGDWAHFASNVNASTTLVETNLGSIPKFRVYTPKNDKTKPASVDHNLSLDEFFKHSGIDSYVWSVNAVVNGQLNKNLVRYGPNRTLLERGKNLGFFDNRALRPTLSYSSYDYSKKKIYASVIPGLFNISEEIFVTVRNKEGEQQKVKLVRNKNSNVYESKENEPVDLAVNKRALGETTVKFELNDVQDNKTEVSVPLVSNKSYLEAIDKLVVDNSGEPILEGKQYYLKTNVNIREGVQENWHIGLDQTISGRYVHFSPQSNWDRLRLGPIQKAIHGADIQATPVMIERKGQPKPGQPFKKDEEVFLKFTSSSYSGYQYLNIGNGYDYNWLDTENNRSSIKLDKLPNQNSFYLKSDSTYITFRQNNWLSSVADNGSAPLVAGSEFILKPEHTTSPGNNHKWELESIK
ncbi:binary toxin-like calcium binding domain-containing protein [Bacillus sp. 166amftsu]|uniref:binary toxin-like calcium binding domain-containing protein n=1 Tax=Bacillus sp. 166amftsu TaxID=1761753 RepID=UPI00089D1872|nr:binary toxin-like calcium binding domain-containing protein [Bacillus sp. 166amftsu]SDZ22880.1 binary toxin B/toxin PA [Bacillus sp. 166amftsu]